MLLLFGQAGEPVDAYIACNFRQVRDMVLLVTYEGKERTPYKTLLYPEDGAWAIIEGEEKSLAGENLVSINMALQALGEGIAPDNTRVL